MATEERFFFVGTGNEMCLDLLWLQKRRYLLVRLIGGIILKILEAQGSRSIFQENDMLVMLLGSCSRVNRYQGLPELCT